MLKARDLNRQVGRDQVSKQTIERRKERAGIRTRRMGRPASGRSNCVRSIWRAKIARCSAEEATEREGQRESDEKRVTTSRRKSERRRGRRVRGLWEGKKRKRGKGTRQVKFFPVDLDKEGEPGCSFFANAHMVLMAGTRPADSFLAARCCPMHTENPDLWNGASIGSGKEIGTRRRIERGSR